MKRSLLIHITLLWLVAGCGFTGNKKAVENEWYTVTHVTDGDTFTIQHPNGTKETIRLIGINAPETHHPKKGREKFGEEAYLYLQSLVETKKVKLVFDKDREDKYGRTLAYVYLENGVFVNAELVKMGYARAIPYKPNLAHQEELESLEQKAKKGRLNMWGYYRE